MSGHSHWANIKRKKEAQDKKKSVFFSKAAKMIMSAIKEGGPNPDTNINLRIAIQYAKRVNMPNANVERLIKKYSSKNTNNFKEILYESLFNKVPILIRVLTDNSNRSLTEIKQVLKEFGGRLAEKGAISWQFNQIGRIVINVPENKDVEEVVLKILDIIEIEDIKEDIETRKIELVIDRENLKKATDKLESAGFQIIESSLQFLYNGPSLTLDQEHQEKLNNLIYKLKQLDDVTDVWIGMSNG